MNEAIIGILILIVVIILFTNRKLKQIEARNEVIYKWMFNSLYSLNPNVLLPEDKEPAYEEEGSVFIDRTSVNRGEQDDWHGLAAEDN